jgi:FkbM family methyltransferase
MRLAISNGREKLVVDEDDPWIGRGVLERGDFEFEFFERAISIVGRRKTLYDLGANIGVTSIPAVARELVDRAVAIEPESTNYRLLRTNVTLNGLDHRIETCRIAAGEEDKMIDLELCKDNSGDHRIRADSIQRDRDAVQVQMRKLSGFVKDPDVDDLVWMDVQGYEARVLQGWPEVVDRRVPLVVEVCPWMLNEYSSTMLLVEQIRRYERCVDLRGDLVAVSTDSILTVIANIPGTHTDLLLY